jgi:hypothetical protein
VDESFIPTGVYLSNVSFFFFIPLSAEAREVFVEVERWEEKPKILTTTDYNEAQAFSEAIYWLCD